ncbi:MAG: hypothetical protein ACLFRT_09655 [Actinomycetota bacterium]
MQILGDLSALGDVQYGVDAGAANQEPTIGGRHQVVRIGDVVAAEPVAGLLSGQGLRSAAGIEAVELGKALLDVPADHVEVLVISLDHSGASRIRGSA